MKICGINDPASFDAAREAGADWIGFVFFPPSPRYVTPKQAYQLSARAASGPPRVGLFVKPTEAEILRTLDVVELDILQLYGAGERIGTIRAHFGGEIWHAAGVREAADLPSQAMGADRLVIEAKPPADANRPGGNAVSFDWAITKPWAPPCPWILAGGLDADNVSTAIRLSGACAVDVSSGVETSSGIKSPERIRAFIRATRNGASLAPCREGDTQG